MLLKSKRCGSAISPALVATMILIVISLGLLSLGLNSRIYSIRTASDIVARYVADVSLSMALFEMNQKLQIIPYTEGMSLETTDVKLPYGKEAR